jgi:ABC-type sugar transport system substrate-binding protein
VSGTAHRTLRLALAAALGLALAACGGRTGGDGSRSGSAGTGPGPGAAGETGSSIASGGGSAARRPVLGAILMQQDQFFRLNENGMTAAAGKLGADLKVQNAAGALDKEASILDTFMTQKVDAILVSPLSSKASIPALKRAFDRGILIVTYNNRLEAEFPVCSISSDQVALGASSGKAARAYIEKNLGGRARVAIIGFASQLPEQGGARQRGFEQELAGMPGVEIVAQQDAWDAPRAATTVTEILTRKPDVIWAANEGGTVGAVTAVRNAGKAGRVAVFGTDVSVQLLDFLLADDGILKAVTAQRPFEMGGAAAETAVSAVRGKPVQKEIVLEGVLFSRENSDELKTYRESLLASSR